MERDRILDDADGQDDSRLGPAELIAQVEKICPTPIFRWPDDLDDAQFLEWALRRLDWSNQEFADYLGLTRKTVSVWINGHQPPKPWVKQILKQLILLRMNMEVFVEHRELT